MHTFEIGTLYTHWRLGQVFMVLSDDRFTVTIQSVTKGKRYKIPTDQFTRWYLPLRRAHE